MWVYFLGSLLIGGYLYYRQATLEDNLFLYGLLTVGIGYSFLFFVIHLFTRKAVKIVFTDTALQITYLYLMRIHQEEWKLKSTELALFEWYKYYTAQGDFELIFYHNSRKVKVTDHFWTSQEIEQIFSEFKSRKNEAIPASELEAYRQLQRHNSSEKKTY